MASSLTTSFPSLYPPDAHDLYSPTLDSAPPPTPPPEGRNAPNQHGASNPPHPPSSRSAASIMSHAQAISALRSDENAIATRKANIRRFGAGWLKPVGIGKTLQGMDDEKLEKEEQEAAAMREQALLEEQAAAEAELAAQEAAQRQQAEDAGEITGEQDLDADIPEASSALDDTEALSPGEEGEERLVDEAEGGLPAAEAEGDGDYALGPGEMMGDESGISMARDLDDDVPEADSYQQSDTDVEI